MTEAVEGVFEVVDVTTWPRTFDEPMGKPGKRWLADPADRRWLWKPNTVQRETSGTFLKGEDRSEKLSCELARILAVPAAEVELAERAGEPGVIVKSVLAEGEQLIHGNEMLSGMLPDYDPDRRQEVPGYTVHHVSSVFDHFDVLPPTSAETDATTAFVAYLALDVLIGNTDRHHANWGALRSADGTLRLSPTFDHASSLGFQLPEAAMTRHTAEVDGVRRYAERARSRPFEGRPTTLELLLTGFSLRPPIADRVRERLANIDDPAVDALLARVPAGRMSYPCRTFTRGMLITNRERIIDACRHINP